MNKRKMSRPPTYPAVIEDYRDVCPALDPVFQPVHIMDVLWETSDWLTEVDVMDTWQGRCKYCRGEYLGVSYRNYGLIDALTEGGVYVDVIDVDDLPDHD